MSRKVFSTSVSIVGRAIRIKNPKIVSRIFGFEFYLDVFTSSFHFQHYSLFGTFWQMCK